MQIKCIHLTWNHFFMPNYEWWSSSLFLIGQILGGFTQDYVFPTPIIPVWLYLCDCYCNIFLFFFSKKLYDYEFLVYVFQSHSLHITVKWSIKRNEYAEVYVVSTLERCGRFKFKISKADLIEIQNFAITVLHEIIKHDDVMWNQ